MKVERLSYEHVNMLDALVLDYLGQSEKLRPFINEFPDHDGFKKILNQQCSRSYDRTVLADCLARQNAHLPLTSYTSENISKLQQSKTFTVTTGHQLCLFTGPLYFPFKIISTIALAKRLKELFPANEFVPVYWLASEDHDSAEIDHVFVAGKKIVWPVKHGGPVGDLPMTGIEDSIRELSEYLGDNQFAIETIETVKRCYENANDLADATRRIVNELFGKYGIVVIDSNDAELKKQLTPVIRDEILNQSGETLAGAGGEALMRNGYSAPLHARSFNFFGLEENQRLRLEKKDQTWKAVDSLNTYTNDELMTKAENNPEFFSPNVIMRPLFQEMILPNIAYVGGPGEVAYWLQLKPLFDHHKVNFPAIVLRDCAMIVNEKLSRKISDTGLKIDIFFLPKHELVSKVVRKHTPDFDPERSVLLEIFESVIKKAGQADRTLEGAARAELQKQIQGLEQLEKKMLKATRQKEQQFISKLENIFDKLFPDNELQERRDNIMEYLALYGNDFIDELLKVFDPLEKNFMIIYPETQKNPGMPAE